MDTNSLLWLAAGLLFGAVVAHWVTRRLLAAHAQAGDAEERAELERGRSETAQARALASDARAEAADARAEAAQARTELARAGTEVAAARSDAANARTAAAEANAAAADVRAELSGVRAELAGAQESVEAARRRAEELRADRESLVNQFKVLSAETLERQGKQADQTAEQRLRATDQLLGPVRESLEKFNARLTEVEKERVAIATELRAQVQTVHATGERLRTETSALVTALRKPQVRGAWGELQLKRVAEVAGMVQYCDFVLQETSQTTDATIRPDMKVNLADGKFIYVDSKMPLSAFLDAQQTTDQHEQQRYLELFAKNVRGHVDALSGKKYWRADTATPEFVVLFMPAEALAAEALQLLPDLHEYAALRNVILATPTTLIALLRSVSYGWKQAALAESAAEVFHLGRELYDRLGTLGGHFDKVGRTLGATVKAYNSAVASMESRVLVTARRFRDLRVSDAELESISGVDEQPRVITATELVADAVQVGPLIGRQPRARLAAAPSNDADALFPRDPDLDDVVRERTPPRRTARDAG